MLGAAEPQPKLKFTAELLRRLRRSLKKETCYPRRQVNILRTYGEHQVNFRPSMGKFPESRGEKEPRKGGKQ